MHALFTIPVTPVVASRPRVTRWGTYYSPKYKQFKEVDGAEALAAVECPLDQPLDVPIAVSLSFICHRPKTTKRTIPVGDVDNYAKAALDLLQADSRWFVNDDLITKLRASKRYADKDESPCIRVLIEPEGNH